MSHEDPREMIAEWVMSRPQIVAVAIAIILNALDGFDVLSISFAAPGIAKDWGLAAGGTGLVLSMDLIGMAVGSIVLGQAGDRYGRRPTIISCLVIIAAGMSFAALAGSIAFLAVARIIAGVGIGGMLATTNAIVAEHSSARRRNMAIALMAGGFPFGAIVGGTIASALLGLYGWHSVFVFGALASAALIPFSFLYLPESVSWLSDRRPTNALDRVNRT